MPAAYLIAEVNVTNPERYKDYSDYTPALIASFGGEYVVRVGQIEHLEGPRPDDRVVVVRFPSMEQAQAFYHSEEYAKLIPIRQEASEAKMYFIEGAD